jgi:hypothetical protein
MIPVCSFFESGTAQESDILSISFFDARKFVSSLALLVLAVQVVVRHQMGRGFATRLLQHGQLLWIEASRMLAVHLVFVG